MKNLKKLSLGVSATTLAFACLASAQTMPPSTPTAPTDTPSTTGGMSTDGTTGTMQGGTMQGGTGTMQGGTGTMQGGTMQNGGMMQGGTMQNGGMMQGGMMQGGMMQGGMMQGGMMQGGMMTPSPVSGTVLRYYVDRSGFVSAMDVQTAEGTRMVRFSPSQAQSLTTMYPVGATANVYVTSSMSRGMTNYYLASMGTEMPSPMGMMMPITVTDLDVLKSEPFVMLGARSMRVTGNLDGYVADERGQVLAIVLKNGDSSTLVRVPRENRLTSAGMAADGVVPLIKGASVVAYGFMEAPRFGVVSPYASRVVATGVNVDGQTLGPLGFGRVMSGGKGTLLGFNVPLGGLAGGASPEEVQANSMGYSTMMMPASGGMMPGGTMGNGTMGNGTMDSGTMGTGTMPGGTMPGGTMPGGTMPGGMMTPGTTPTR